MRQLLIRAVPAGVFLALSLLTLWAWRQQPAGAGLAVPVIGVLFSAGLGGLIHQLFLRMELYRVARDQALQEVQKKEQARAAMRESEARYLSVFDSATEGLLLLDGQGRIVEANPSACAMHGYEQKGLQGRPMEDLLAPDHEDLLEEFNKQIREDGAAHVDLVTRRMDGGPPLELEVRGTALDLTGSPHVLAFLTDMSELHQALQRHSQLSRKVLMAQEEERARVSRDLHDELGQILTALRLEISWLHKKAGKASPDVAEAFGGAVEMVEKAAEELRRICKGLRPPLLDDLGLEPAMRLLVEDFEEWTGLDISYETLLDEGEPDVPPEVGLCTYRILQESLNNITRHAGARHVNIKVADSGEELVLSVYDDGRGFDTSDRDARKGSGIAGMRERAYLVNGSLHIRSEPHQGTRVTLRVPLNVSRRETR